MTSLWLKRGAWVGSGRVVSAALTFGQNILLTRLLSPSDAGLYFLILSFAWGASLFAQWGSATEVVRQIGEAVALGHPGLAKRFALTSVMRTVFRAFIMTLLLCFVPTLVYQVLFSVDFSTSIRLLIAVITFITTLQAMLPEVFRGFHKLGWASIFAGPLPNGLGLLLLIFLSISREPATLLNVTIAMSIGGGLSLIFVFGLMMRIFSGAGRNNASLDYGLPGDSRFQISDPTPIAIAQIAAFFLNQADFLVLGSVVPKDQLALYGAAQRLTVILLMPMAIVGSILLTKIAELWTQRRIRDLQDVLSAGVMLSFLPAFCLWLVYLVAGQFLLGFVFGEFYRQAYSVLLILSSIQIFHIGAGLSGYVLLMANQQRAMMRISTLSAATSFIMSFILSRYAGLMGAAVGSGTGIVVLTVWMSIIVRRELGLKPALNPKEFIRIARGWIRERPRVDRRPGV